MGLVEERATDKKTIKQVVRAATVLDAPPMIGAGIVGYVQTPRGIRQAYTVWAAHVADSCKRRFNKKSTDQITAFAKHETAMKQNAQLLNEQIAQLKKECCIIRLLAHTQPELTPLEVKKA